MKTSDEKRRVPVALTVVPGLVFRADVSHTSCQNLKTSSSSTRLFLSVVPSVVYFTKLTHPTLNARISLNYISQALRDIQLCSGVPKTVSSQRFAWLAINQAWCDGIPFSVLRVSYLELGEKNMYTENTLRFTVGLKLGRTLTIKAIGQAERTSIELGNGSCATRFTTKRAALDWSNTTDWYSVAIVRISS